VATSYSDVLEQAALANGYVPQVDRSAAG